MRSNATNDFKTHLRLVDEVNFDGLQDLRLHEVPDAGLGHHRDGHGGFDRLNHFRVRHTGHACSIEINIYTMRQGQTDACEQVGD